ncbi:MAG TPA: hypothetical protein VKB69_13630 [Micromonosporaceae bacterium]|nr:hypothetical protein [Micromonosporaceae bacterium]
MPVIAGVAALAVGVPMAIWLSGGQRSSAAYVGADPAHGPQVATQRTASRPAVVPVHTEPPPATLHYISNTGPNVRRVAALGYNLFDLGPNESVIDSLGPGQQALVWLGNLDNTRCTPDYPWNEFTAAVRRLAHNPKVFGYYISDEPHPSLCPNAVHDIRERADYIHAQNPRQKSFIVVLDAYRICGAAAMGCEYRQLTPATTHVDLFGIDPFPCQVATGCEMEKIPADVQRAVDAGIPISQIVPVIQAFGQSCGKSPAFYLQPTTEQLEQILAGWAAVVPHPVFDFTYTWRSEGPACPGLDSANGDRYPDLQEVMRDHNGR